MRILIVEDEEKLVVSLKKGLQKEGYATDVALDGENAMQLAEWNDYDLILLDLMLPKKDGITVCRELRENNIATPILMLTAKDALSDKIIGLDSGADDYLVKPFSFEELLARIRSLLRRKAELIPPVLKVGTLTLNPATREVKRGEKKINLTTKEFALLEYLMHNTGKALSRDQILDHVWDREYQGWSNVVDVHIKALRRKIDHGQAQKLIHTIRGVGYSLKE